MTRKIYKTGIQKSVLHVIENSKKVGLPYITKKQIMKEVSKIVDFKDKNKIPNKVGQALYQLQRKSKYRRPRIKKYIDKDGNMVGWTSTKNYIELINKKYPSF